MITNDDYALYSLVRMKKKHSCSFRSDLFKVIRLGMDIKLECQGCKGIITLLRNDFNSKVKEVIKK